MRLAIPWRCSAAVLLWALAGLSPALALDNPDTPDLVAAFEQRMKPLEAHFGEQTTTVATNEAGQAYAKALDAELNRSYLQLLSKLGEGDAKKLRASQRAWLQHAKAENDFIDSNWSQANFGTSAVFSRWTYRNALTKQRVTSLLYYLQNY